MDVPKYLCVWVIHYLHNMVRALSQYRTDKPVWQPKLVWSAKVCVRVGRRGGRDDWLIISIFFTHLKCSGNIGAKDVHSCDVQQLSKWNMSILNNITHLYHYKYTTRSIWGVLGDKDSIYVGSNSVLSGGTWSSGVHADHWHTCRPDMSVVCMRHCHMTTKPQQRPTKPFTSH